MRTEDREVPVQRAVKVQTGVGRSCLLALAPIHRVHTPGWPSRGIFESYFSSVKKKRVDRIALGRGMRFAVLIGDQRANLCPGWLAGAGCA